MNSHNKNIEFIHAHCSLPYHPKLFQFRTKFSMFNVNRVSCFKLQQQICTHEKTSLTRTKFVLLRWCWKNKTNNKQVSNFIRTLIPFSVLRIAYYHIQVANFQFQMGMLWLSFWMRTFLNGNVFKWKYSLFPGSDVLFGQLTLRLYEWMTDWVLCVFR